MFWVSWRLQRTETLIAAAILALIAALLIPTGLDMASAYHHDGLSACLGQNPSDACDQAVHGFTSRFDGTKNLLAWFTLVPGVIGVLFAAPFILELENGFRLYHMGDTGLFGDMKMIGERYHPDLLLIPIGGHFVMDPKDAAYATRELLKPKFALPIHYGTIPQLAGTPAEYQQALGDAKVKVFAIQPGEKVTF